MGFGIYNPPMPLSIHSLSDIAARIDQPFSLISLGLVGDIGAHLYVAQGQLNWHKHIDEDELFLVHEGAVQIETELGSAALRAGDAMLVPKGVGHRSGSARRSVVLLIRQQVFPERKNGHRNYLVIEKETTLKKIRVGQSGAPTARPFEPASLMRLDDYGLTVFVALDSGPAENAKAGGALLYALRGAVRIQTDDGPALLEAGQLVILPSHTAYQIHSAQPAVVVKFERE